MFCVCAPLYVPGSVCAWRVRCHKIGRYTGAPQQQQYNCRSRVSSSCLCASSHGVRVCGCAQREIEPRQQQFHVQCNNQTHRVGPHTRYTKHTAGTKAVAQLKNKNLSTSAKFQCSIRFAPRHTAGIAGTGHFGKFGTCWLPS